MMHNISRHYALAQYITMLYSRSRKLNLYMHCIESDLDVKKIRACSIIGGMTKSGLFFRICEEKFRRLSRDRQGILTKQGGKRVVFGRFDDYRTRPKRESQKIIELANKLVIETDKIGQAPTTPHKGAWESPPP